MTQIAAIIVLGIFAQWIAWRTRLPAILPLIIIGLLVGPIATLYTVDGSKFVEPLYNAQKGKFGLFPGETLFYFVSLAIGIILFEGGLTLKRKEIKEVGPSILRLISVGSLITFVGAGIAAHYIMGLNWQISFLFSGLIIVTGPTVIAPILRNVPLKRNVATVLKWEGILIDPIGALVAVLVFEFIITGDHGQEYTQHAFIQFMNIVLIGLALGAISAYTLFQLIKNHLIPEYLLNVFTLALVLMVFVLSDILAHESGLLSVVVMGMVLGNLNVPRFKEILDFKESLSILLISILFILLSANIDIADLQLLLDWRCLALFGVVVLVLRPLGVFWSTRNSGLETEEKIFISWVGPRGIVAAGIASLFGLKLVGKVPDAEFITPLVFMIVLGTVLLNATTARILASALGITLKTSDGIFIVGANPAAIAIGAFLQKNGRHVVLVDNNDSNIQKARDAGVDAIVGNIYAEEFEDDFELLDMGYLIAMTSSTDVNIFALNSLKKVFGEKGAFRLISSDELKQDKSTLPQSGILSYYDDFINLSEVLRDYPKFHEIPVSDHEILLKHLKAIGESSNRSALFFKDPAGRLDFIPYELKDLNPVEGCALIYAGKAYLPSEEQQTSSEKTLA